MKNISAEADCFSIFRNDEVGASRFSRRFSSVGMGKSSVGWNAQYTTSGASKNKCQTPCSRLVSAALFARDTVLFLAKTALPAHGYLHNSGKHR